MRRPLVVGNWKMNGDLRFTARLLDELTAKWAGVHEAEVAVCPPFPYLALAAEMLENSNIALGAQNMSHEFAGDDTGEVSASMLGEFGCKYVIVGHSDRRRFQNESSEIVAKKFKVAVDAHLVPVLCVGEDQQEREKGRTFDVIGRQLLKVVEYCGLDMVAKGSIAYEPVWADGSDSSEMPQIAQDVHSYIREVLGPEGDQIKILYGGSVQSDIAGTLFKQKDIDGALVSGASLKARDKYLQSLVL